MGKNSYSGRNMLRRDSGAGQAYTRMMRQRNKNVAIVYVEGDSDVLFYRWIIDDSRACLQHMIGKEAAMDAVISANKRNQSGVLALVDSDFDHILSIVNAENIIITDTHDIETLMIRDGAFEYVRDSYIDPNNLRTSEYDENSLWNKVIEIAKAAGKIRLLSNIKGWNMKFSDEGMRGKDNLEAEGVIKYTHGKIQFDAHAYIYECIRTANNCSVDVATAYAEFLNESNEYDTWQICRGHDLTRIISILYSKSILGKKNVYKDEIEKIITSTYIASGKFVKTNMYSDIKKWEEGNSPWKILKDETEEMVEEGIS